MNEDLPNQNRQDEAEWQAPPPPINNAPVEEPAQMSEVGTLGSIFFEPGATFEDLRRKPRFVLASLIVIILISGFSFLFIQKVGFEEITRARLEKNSMYQSATAEAKQELVRQQTQPFVKYISYFGTPIFMMIYLLIGGLIYWLGANAMGGSMTFLRGLSVWVYSSLPPTVVSMLANTLVLFLKSVDDIDIVGSQGGLIQANPTLFLDTKAMPVLGAIIATFDVFFIWGWILAAIGLRIVGKISTTSAWAIVLIVALINVAFRVVGALFS